MALHIDGDSTALAGQTAFGIGMDDGFTVAIQRPFGNVDAGDPGLGQNTTAPDRIGLDGATIRPQDAIGADQVARLQPGVEAAGQSEAEQGFGASVDQPPGAFLAASRAGTGDQR